MSTSKQAPVLIVGGSGIVGAQTARTLRRLHPDLPLAIGGRNIEKARAVAADIGNAVATTVDLDRPDLGLEADARYKALAVFVKDETLNSLRFAQRQGLPHVSVSSGTFEIGPDVALFVHAPKAAPILMASQWLAGAATLPILHLAADYARLEAIHIGVVLDEQDMGGPAASADFERLTTVAPAALTLQDGRFSWLTGDAAKGRLHGVDGVELDTFAYSPLDIVSLAAATAAGSIRLDLAYGESASRRRGLPFSTEIIIELAGTRQSGERGRFRHEIVHPAGQAPLTALGVALGLERLLGLAGGAPVAPGLHLPETLIEPGYFVRRLRESGASFTQPAMVAG